MVIDAKPADIAALVAFGVPARTVDGLIEKLLGTDVKPARWFVFEADMDAVGALNEVWKGTIDIVMCAIPSVDCTVVAAALEILSSEGVPLDQCAWVHAAAHRCDGLDSIGVVLPVDVNAASLAQNVLLCLAQWQDAKQGHR